MTRAGEYDVEADDVYITAPVDGQLVRGGDVLTITGSARGTDFADYAVEYGQGASPGSWATIVTSTTPVTDSVLAVWDTSVITVADDYTIRVTRHGTLYNPSAQVAVYVDPTWQAGWPQSVYGRLVAPSLSIGDLKGDGDLSLVATVGRLGGNLSYIHVWHDDGTNVPGWPHWLPGDRPSAPALADLDRDGDLEIVVGAYDGNVHAWHHDGILVSGWPASTGADVFAAPAVADLDRDGVQEVVAAALDGSLHVWHYDGTVKSGWPLTTGTAFYGAPALGDLDGDGDLEIVAAQSGAVHAWHDDGSTVTGWPATVAITDTYASPALGDVDDDGDQEVVAAIGSQVYVWEAGGSTITGWPKAVGGVLKSSPALGDLDDDGDLEIVVGAGQVYAWHHDGTAVTGWPVAVAEHTNASPVLGDITGDGDADVVIGAGDLDAHVYAWQGNGSPLPGWPRRVLSWSDSGGRFDRLASPMLSDLDTDGDIEVAIAAEDHVFVFDLPAAYSGGSALEWPIYGHDLRLTGWYTAGVPNLPPFVQQVRAEPGYVAPGSPVTVTAHVTDEDSIASVQAQIESPDENVLGTLALHDDGAHGDGAAGDGVYGNTWTTPGTKQDYVVDVIAVDALGLSCTHDNAAGFTSVDVPYVQYHSHAIQQESLVGDGTPNPGEYVEGTITLQNLGSLDAPGVTATLSAGSAHIWLLPIDPLHFGDIAAGSTATSGDYTFCYQVSPMCPHGYVLTFVLRIEDGLGHVWTDTFDVTVMDSADPHRAYMPIVTHMRP